jgi:hypothetical protein
MTNEKGIVVSKPLTLKAIAQTNTDMYIATSVFPIVLAPTLKGTYKYYSLGDLQKFEVELRKPGASFKNVSLELEEKSFNCQHYGLRYPCPREFQEELADMLQTGANYLYEQGLRTLEYQFASTFLKQSVFGTDATPTTKWNATGSNPIADFKLAKKTIREDGRATAQYAVMTEDVFDALCENEDIKDRMAVDTFRAVTSEAQLAQILGLREIYVVRETSVTEICVVFAKNTVTPVESPNAGLIVIRDYAKIPKDGKGIAISAPFYDQDTHSDALDLELHFTMITPAPTLGYCFYNVLT